MAEFVKISQSAALYFHPASIGDPEGAHCGICMMFVPGKLRGMGTCTVVEGDINGLVGICGLYVHGEHHGEAMKGTLSKTEAGYTEQGPTHCANCEYFHVNGDCDRVLGKVQGKGCCNLWEPK